MQEGGGVAGAAPRDKSLSSVLSSHFGRKGQAIWASLKTHTDTDLGILGHEGKTAKGDREGKEKREKKRRKRQKRKGK